MTERSLSALGLFLASIAAFSTPTAAEDKQKNPGFLTDLATNCQVWDNDIQEGDRVSWKGECVNGLAEGYGSATYTYIDLDTGRTEQVIYDGVHKAGKRNGTFTATYSNGARFEGTYVDHKREGPGRYRYKTGSVFEGTYYNGKREGQGVMTYMPSGDRFEGTFHDGDRHEGKYTFGQGGYYQGEFRDHVFGGKGRAEYVTGKVSEGDWDNDKLNGWGRIEWKRSGTSYSGRVKDNVPHGRGAKTFSDGKTYYGRYENGKRDGWMIIVDRWERPSTYDTVKDMMLHGPKNVSTEDIEREIREDIDKSTHVARFENDRMVPGTKRNVVEGGNDTARHNKAIADFRFPIINCGTFHKFVKGDKKRTIEAKNAANKAWITCEESLTDERQNSLRTLIVHGLGGTWEKTPDKRVNWSVTKECTECKMRVRQLFDEMNRRVEAFSRERKQLQDNIRWFDGQNR